MDQQHHRSEPGMESQKRPLSRDSSLDRPIVKKRRQTKLTECTICAEDLPTKAFPRRLGHRSSNTRHATCSTCWQQHLSTEVASNKPPAEIHCPQCPYTLRERDIQALASPDTHAAYLDKLLQETLKQDPSYRTCPSATCSFGYFLTRDDDQSDSIFNCRVCEAQYCVRCEVPMHRGITCEAYQEEHGGERRSREELASETFLKEHAKACPGCGAKIRKNGGCDHMTCSKCNHEFCWVCYAPYQGTDGVFEIGNEAHTASCAYHSSAIAEVPNDLNFEDETDDEDDFPDWPDLLTHREESPDVGDGEDEIYDSGDNRVHDDAGRTQDPPNPTTSNPLTTPDPPPRDSVDLSTMFVPDSSLRETVRPAVTSTPRPVNVPSARRPSSPYRARIFPTGHTTPLRGL